MHEVIRQVPGLFKWAKNKRNLKNAGSKMSTTLGTVRASKNDIINVNLKENFLKLMYWK